MEAATESRTIHAILDGAHVFHGLRAFGVAWIVVIAATAGRARASCAITLDGDAGAVAQVGAELEAFPDDSAPCLALWAQCRRTGDQLEIDLHDELGRSSFHLFASPAGAAAFLVSWSRRPLSGETAASPPLAPPGAIAARAPAAVPPAPSRARPWHLELGASYARISRSGINASQSLPDGTSVAVAPRSTWMTISAALVRRSELVRYGAALRAISSNLRDPTAEADAIVGVALPVSDQVSVLGDLAAGATFNFGSARDYDYDYDAVGLRARLRGALGWQLVRSLQLEVGVAYDLVRQIGSIPPTTLGGTTILFGQLELGLRWIL